MEVSALVKALTGQFFLGRVYSRALVYSKQHARTEESRSLLQCCQFYLLTQPEINTSLTHGCGSEVLVRG